MDQKLINATLISNGTGIMLEANGYDDAKRGIDRETGWKEIAEALDYPVHTRTPAQERYLDGWYRGKS